MIHVIFNKDIKYWSNIIKKELCKREEFMLKSEKEQKLKEKTKGKTMEEIIELMIASLENSKEEIKKS